MTMTAGEQDGSRIYTRPWELEFTDAQLDSLSFNSDPAFVSRVFEAKRRYEEGELRAVMGAVGVDDALQEDFVRWGQLFRLDHVRHVGPDEYLRDRSPLSRAWGAAARLAIAVDAATETGGEVPRGELRFAQRALRRAARPDRPWRSGITVEADRTALKALANNIGTVAGVMRGMRDRELAIAAE